jgi:ABC-type sugar transport system ATPase subunit
VNTVGAPESIVPPSGDKRAPLLEVEEISKSFEGVKALDTVSLNVGRGEIVAVVGHNGSGKSTLVKVLAGVYKADPGGEIRICGKDGEIISRGAGSTHLHFIHQDAGLIEPLSTIENFDLVRPLKGSDLGPLSTRAERREAKERIARFGGSFDVTKPVSTLAAAEKSIVAIARALAGWENEDNVLVLDEPTAALHRNEVSVLFEAVRRVSESGTGVIFISHRLDEVMDLADRVVALRDGKVVADKPRAEADHDALVRMIAGRDIKPSTAAAERAGAGEVALRVRGISGAGLTPTDLDLHAGEIVGLTGLIGSGADRLAGLIFGSVPRESGVVEIDGVEIPAGRPRAAIRAGVAYVPPDRHRFGAVMTMSGRENLTMVSTRAFQRAFGYVDVRAERRDARMWTEKVDLRPRNPELPIASLSGGNQQKIVLAKWLRTNPKVLLLDEPTHGVDIGAKSAIYELIVEAAEGGAAVLVSSAEVKELVDACDRVLVMRDGVTVGEVQRKDVTEARLVRESLGVAS